MGQKVHPTGFRLGIIYDWQGKWFADRDYHKLLQEDLAIRGYISEHLADASISKVEIERNANQVTATIHTAKPGIVIGRGGQKVDELRNELEKLTGKRIRVNIQEIRMPEMDAYLVARNIADQLERRVAFRRALKQTVSRTMARGAEGCKAMVAGRLGGSEMSRREHTMEGRVPLHTIRANIDFGRTEARTTFGRIGVKVWIYKGDILPEKTPEQETPSAAAEAAVTRPGAQTTETRASAEAPASPPSAEAPASPPSAEGTETPASPEAPASPPSAEGTETPASPEAPASPPSAEGTETPPSAESTETPASAKATESPAPASDGAADSKTEKKEES